MYGPANAYAEVADCGSDLGFLPSDDCLSFLLVLCFALYRSEKVISRLIHSN
jgi:hypothetical protein